MCAQCASTGVITTAAAATGARVWIAAYAPVWLTPVRKRAISGVAVVAGVIGAGLFAG
ncbi:MAG: hypothetical protein AVDCRST_MAG65-1015 [uncultured Solirubrobacteraceae bacterium]|uniref:Uncharacterized protein n=1 Tax=uncultured Solirubrobacteraceae bacterium TaxID=1162706 RepID=A0A6J4RM29_9ACTN|nr:MAG: hypothetical protein AVDCRST_MAG65-1015 [uncultured Solirubrobacteraceae bacterium]